MRHALAVFVMVAGLTGCQTGFQGVTPKPGGLEVQEDPVAMKSAVLWLMPLGTSRQQVEEIMYGQGIDCVYGDANTHRYHLSKPTRFLHTYDVDLILYFDGAGKLSDVTVKGEDK